MWSIAVQQEAADLLSTARDTSRETREFIDDLCAA